MYTCIIYTYICLILQMKYLTFEAITRTFIYKAYNKPGMLERSFLLFEHSDFY